MIAHCRAHLPGYKCPKRVIFAEAIPKNGVGKVLKAELVQAYGPLPHLSPSPARGGGEVRAEQDGEREGL